MGGKAPDFENLRHLPVGDLRNPDFGPYRNDNRLLPSFLRGAGIALHIHLLYIAAVIEAVVSLQVNRLFYR